MLQRPATLGSAAPPRSPTPVSSPEDVSPTGRRGRAGPEPVLSEDEQVLVHLPPLVHILLLVHPLPIVYLRIPIVHELVLKTDYTIGSFLG